MKGEQGNIKMVSVKANKALLRSRSLRSLPAKRGRYLFAWVLASDYRFTKLYYGSGFANPRMEVSTLRGESLCPGGV